MTEKHYSLNEVAKIAGVKAHRIAYAIANGYLPEPAQRVTNRRLFSTADLQAALLYFAKPNKLDDRPQRMVIDDEPIHPSAIGNIGKRLYRKMEIFLRGLRTLYSVLSS